LNKYRYEGPIMLFESCIQNKWSGETMAESEAKARNNLTYQAKKACGRVGRSQIWLPGKVYLVGGSN